MDPFLSASLATIEVTLPDSDITLSMRELTVGQIEAWRRSLPTDAPSGLEEQLSILSLSLLNPDGEPGYTVDQLREQPFKIISFLTDACMELNGLTGQAVEVAEGN